MIGEHSWITFLCCQCRCQIFKGERYFRTVFYYNFQTVLVAIVCLKAETSHYGAARGFYRPSLQPQHNRTQPEVGFDMIFGLHIFLPSAPPKEPPTTRNSTSTRKNEHRGLKFRTWPHLTKLTSNQHNLNPTIFWGGGISPPPAQG